MSINPGTTPGYVPQSQPASYTAPPAQQTVYAPPAPAGSSKIPILFGAVIALLAGIIYLFIQVNNLRTEVNKNQTDLLAELDKMREASAVSLQTSRRTIEALSAQLETARRQANMLAGQARIDALKKVEETRAQLEAAQKRQEEAVNSQFSQVKQTQDATNSKLGEVNTEVGTVKTDLGTTKSELEKTVADLKRVSGDVDGHSSLIATNGKELSALRALGERNYFEFNVHKSKQPQKVGDIALLLKKADPKHNRYTVELTADDKTVEKKDRTINEPLQFLTSKAKQPYEIVVNDVKKDQIAGYLAVPKVLTGR